jgi:response regulator RpfG family c-di-GMP phosphodiesterase
MSENLLGKAILMVKGSLLSTDELEAALKEQGARVQTASNIISAFALVERRRFDGAILDKGLHNEAFDLCAELKERRVPYLLSNKPHECQKPGARRRAANDVVKDLIMTMGTKRGTAEPARMNRVSARVRPAAQAPITKQTGAG